MKESVNQVIYNGHNMIAKFLGVSIRYLTPLIPLQLNRIEIIGLLSRLQIDLISRGHVWQIQMYLAHQSGR